MKVWIGLGSNIGDGARNIHRAMDSIRALEGVRVLRQSSLYSSAPWGHSNQAKFTNAVAELDTRLKPSELLAALQAIENDMGRERGKRRWGPRNIDIDILLLGDRVLNFEALTVPHPRMHLRVFVLLPLCELEPDLPIPDHGSARSCLDGLDGQEVTRLSDAHHP